MDENNKFTQDLQDSVQTITTTFNNIAKSLIPIYQSIHHGLYQAYMEAGHPYGESDEGLLHWMEDLSKIRDHQYEIDRIKQSHQSKIDARKLGERIRARAIEREAHQWTS